jgi:biopolymer transport protein ExbD
MHLRSGYEQRRARVEMIPLIDCIFLLLVFFIYATLSMVVHSGIKVELPAASTAQVDRHNYVSVSIDAHDAIYVSRQRVSAAELPARVRAAMRGKADMPVFVSGDVRAHLGVAIEVLDRLRQAGVKQVSFESTLKRP